MSNEQNKPPVKSADTMYSVDMEKLQQIGEDEPLSFVKSDDGDLERLAKLDGGEPLSFEKSDDGDMSRLAQLDGHKGRSAPSVAGEQYEDEQHEMLLDHFYASIDTHQNLKQLLNSMLPVRWLGYLLIYLFVIDVVNESSPANFFNAAWQLGAINTAVDRIVIPLLGLVMILWGGNYLRGKVGRISVWLVSWSSLWIALILFLLIPLTITNTSRMQDLIDKSATESVQGTQAQLQEILAAIDNAENIQTLAVIARRLGMKTGISRDTDLGKAKQMMHDLYAEQQAKIAQKISTKGQRSLGGYQKQQNKLVLTLLGTGIFLLLVWLKTGWARRILSEKQEQ